MFIYDMNDLRSADAVRVYAVSFHFEIETSKHFPALGLRAAGKAQTQGARG